jgi:hypothetical protein
VRIRGLLELRSGHEELPRPASEGSIRNLAEAWRVVGPTVPEGGEAMRALRWFVASAVLGSLLAVPTTALANGGAYIEFRPSAGQGGGTHFLSGGSATGMATVYVPRRQRSILGGGPFYAFLLPSGPSGPSGAELREGHPLPDGTIRLGTFSILHRKGSRYDLSIDFMVPDVPGGFYEVGVCDLPCTVSGFRESLTGSISIVATAREARLLTAQARLRSVLSASHRDLRKAERSAAGVQLLLDRSQQDAAEAAAEAVAREAGLERALAAARAEANEGMPLAAWFAGIAGAVAILALIVVRRRNGRFVVPDTIEELESTRERAGH